MYAQAKKFAQDVNNMTQHTTHNTTQDATQEHPNTHSATINTDQVELKVIARDNFYKIVINEKNKPDGIIVIDRYMDDDKPVLRIAGDRTIEIRVL